MFLPKRSNPSSLFEYWCLVTLILVNSLEFILSLNRMQILFFKLMVFCHERFFRHRRESVLENISCKEKKGWQYNSTNERQKVTSGLSVFRNLHSPKQNFAGETNVFQHSFHRTIRSCLNLSHYCFTRLKKKTKVFPLKNLEVLSKVNVILLHNAWFLSKGFFLKTFYAVCALEILIYSSTLNCTWTL